MSTDYTVATPHYLLLGSNGPVGPDIMQSAPAADQFVVYGFSSRQQYDRFTVAGHAVLRPYPLLNGHLTKPSDYTGNRITLIAIDADGPEELEVRATSAESLVQALASGIDQVAVEFHLVASHRGGVYQILAVPP